MITFKKGIEGGVRRHDVVEVVLANLMVAVPQNGILASIMSKEITGSPIGTVLFEEPRPVSGLVSIWPVDAHLEQNIDQSRKKSFTMTIHTSLLSLSNFGSGSLISTSKFLIRHNRARADS